jgi:rhamnosyl/mannosyltransferase
MPSIWEETAGLSAMEHMMRGRMVIATDIGGLGELVDAAGFKFPLGDIDGLTYCMKRVIDEPGLAKALGEKAGKRARAVFDERRMLTEHLALYGELTLEGGFSPAYVAEGK